MSATDAELDRALRTILARLELVSSAPTQRYDASGGDNDGMIALGATTPCDRYHRRLADIDRGLQRRLDASEATGDFHQRDAEESKAHDWHHSARESVLTDATRELAQLTGRDGSAPERRGGELDTEKGIAKAIEDDAPGKPAEDVAAKLGLSVFIVRRRYAELGLYPVDGTPMTTTETDTGQDAKVAEMKAKGLTSRQIAALLGMHQTQVIRAMKRVA